jgi:hypothetical protein
MFKSKKLVISYKLLVSGSVSSSVVENLFKLTFILFIVIGFWSCKEEVTENNITVKSNPTFEDIAPIIYKNCTPCHRAGESGPIEFMTYDDVKKNVNKIKFVTQSGYMPPWPADDSYTHFIGERKLYID